MKRLHLEELSPEMVVKLQKAEEYIRNKEERTLRCPRCKHPLLIIYSGASGQVKNKCIKCKKELLIDLVNMRKINYTII